MEKQDILKVVRANEGTVLSLLKAVEKCKKTSIHLESLTDIPEQILLPAAFIL